MKNSFLRRAVLIALVSLSVSLPLSADDKTDMLEKAFDLVHQAWNPAGDPPSNEQRTDLLNQALKLMQDAPDHHLRNHRVQAILDVKAALAEIQKGDPDQKAKNYIHDANDELRTALSIAH